MELLNPPCLSQFAKGNLTISSLLATTIITEYHCRYKIKFLILPLPKYYNCFSDLLYFARMLMKFKKSFYSRVRRSLGESTLTPIRPGNTCNKVPLSCKLKFKEIIHGFHQKRRKLFVLYNMEHTVVPIFQKSVFNVVA